MFAGEAANAFRPFNVAAPATEATRSSRRFIGMFVSLPRSRLIQYHRSPQDTLARRHSLFDIVRFMRTLVLIAFAASIFGQSPKLPPDIDPQSNSRLPLIQRDQLSDEDKKVFDDVA